METRPRSFDHKGVFVKETRFPLFYLSLQYRALRCGLIKAVDLGIFKGVKLPILGPILSIFQYADDAIFLGE